MFAESPHVSSVLRSRMLEKGSQGFLEDLQNLVQQDKRHPLVKEMAAVITDERFTVFSAKDHYIFAIRNPVEQVWSLLCGIVQHSEAFRSFVLRTPECESIYHKLSSTPSLTPDSLQQTAPLLERFLRETEQVNVPDVATKWFDEDLVSVTMRSWLRMEQLHEWVRARGSTGVTVVDFSLLRLWPQTITLLCDELEIPASCSMTQGPWNPCNKWFVDGTEDLNGSAWVERAGGADRLVSDTERPYELLDLPLVLRGLVAKSMESYLRLLAAIHPAILSLPDQDEARALLLLEKFPSTAWALNQIGAFRLPFKYTNMRKVKRLQALSSWSEL